MFESELLIHIQEWEKLAGAVKGLATVAYWDTEQGPPPSQLGDFRGTPTIRMFKPKPKQKAGENKKKIVLDYNQERKAKDIKKFVDYNMPNYVESVVNGVKDLDKFDEKAKKYGLPRAMLFVSKPDTMPLTKYLSAEFRRKLLLAEVKPTKKNREIMDKFEVTDLPALIVFTDEDEMVRYEGEGFSRHKLHSFLSKHALKKMVVPKTKAEGSEEKPAAEEPKPVKEEL